MTDRGIPKSYRHMHGFGSHTYSLINAAGERNWVKFHFRTQQGIENLTDEEAGEPSSATDRESHQRDLFDAIERGDFPKWTLYIQVMPEADAATYRFHPFDLTKVWSQKDYPLIEVGEFELNRNPDNYFADVEQAAFTPANLVPGISLQPGQDAAGPAVLLRRRRPLPGGRQPPPDPGQLPTCRQAGQHLPPRRRHARRRQPGWSPGYRAEQLRPVGRAARLRRSRPAIGSTADHFDFREDDDNYFEQPGNLFRLMTGDEQQRLFENTARAIKGARHETVEKHIENCTQADPAYGEGVRKACEALGAL